MQEESNSEGARRFPEQTKTGGGGNSGGCKVKAKAVKTAERPEADPELLRPKRASLRSGRFSAERC